MKNNILIIPDIHQRYHWIVSCLNDLRRQYDKVVFLGDMFDDFNDHPSDVTETASLVQHLVHTKDFGKIIFCLSNHDIAYRYWNNYYLKCSGNQEWKYDIISLILKASDWNKFELFHYEKDSKGREWYFSHGGICENLFSHPIEGLTKSIISKVCKKALIDASSSVYNEVLQAGFARGNYNQRQGGITWLDWKHEFKPIKNINQIVGHTPLHEPEKYNNEARYTQIKNSKKIELVQPILNSENWCFDTHSKHIGWWKDGEVSYEKNRWL